jgi:hypothetical protein
VTYRFEGEERQQLLDALKVWDSLLDDSSQTNFILTPQRRAALADLVGLVRPMLGT